MSVPAGTVIGQYTIVSPLGAGGMGEVYRARDGKLQRDVAIKVLPAAVAADADRRARFEREAQVLAALNDPHIGAIYGVVEEPGTTGLVLELVEGPTLADRIAEGPIPFDEALLLARQIAEALEAAHEAGILHRDLKPANIKLRPDGTVKVLDFGLAKAMDSTRSGISSDLTSSPTLIGRATEAGVILGTAAYMAPEQARGRHIDKRVDIWAYGVVLFEMLAGGRLFDGETISDILAAVLTKEVDWSRLPPRTPRPVVHLLRRCLERDPSRRLRDMGEARVLLSDPATLHPPAQADVHAGPVRSWRLWLGLGALGALVGVAVPAVVLWPRATPPAPIALEIVPPSGMNLALADRPAVSVSADGATIVFVARRLGLNKLFVKRREEPTPRPIEGTEGASGPVISPDGRRIAFLGGGRLRLIGVDGGAVTDVIAISDSRGMAWRDNEHLIVSNQPVAGLVEVTTAGGQTRTVTTLAPGERTHRWPSVLPGGKAMVFTVGGFANPDDYDDSSIDIVDFASGTRRTLIKGARTAIANAPGVVLLSRVGRVSALRVDDNGVVSGAEPIPVIQGVAGDKTTGASHLALAADGNSLAFVPGDPQGGLLQIIWSDSHGAVVPAFDVAPAFFLDPSLSPDGRRAAVVVGAGGANDIWIYDFGRKTFNRFTFGGNNTTPVWSLDGRTIYYGAIEPLGTKTTIYRRPSDGSRGAEAVAALDARVYLKQVNEARSELLLDTIRNLQQRNVERVRMAGGAASVPESLVATTFDENGGALSPDGRWLAYCSDETGRSEIYVRDVAGGGRWQVSLNSGEEPRWAPDGHRLFFRSSSRLMVSRVTTNPGFEAEAPVMLFDGAFEYRTDSAATYGYDSKSDRFLMARPAVADEQSDRVRVLFNWSTTLARLLSR